MDVYVYVRRTASHTLGRMVGQLSGGSEADGLAVAQGMQRASATLQAANPPQRYPEQPPASVAETKKHHANAHRGGQRRGRTKMQAGKPIGNAYRPSKPFRPGFQGG